MGRDDEVPFREGVCEVALAVAIALAFVVWTWPVVLLTDGGAEQVAAMWADAVRPIKTWLGIE